MPYIRRNQNMLLQHDNARPHVARLTADFLRRSNVRTLDNWPALSADLNPYRTLLGLLEKTDKEVGS